MKPLVTILQTALTKHLPADVDYTLDFEETPDLLGWRIEVMGKWMIFTKEILEDEQLMLHLADSFALSIARSIRY